jgi:hypothetical protein
MTGRCPAVERSGANDYDAWQAWVINLLDRYAICAARRSTRKRFTLGLVNCLKAPYALVGLKIPFLVKVISRLMRLI